MFSVYCVTEIHVKRKLIMHVKITRLTQQLNTFIYFFIGYFTLNLK